MESLERLVAQFAAGGMAVVFDGEDRENEADIIVSIDHLTPQHVGFLVKEAKGLVCAAISEDIANQKALPLMPTNKRDKHATAFTVSVDSRRARTGISPQERYETAKDLLDPQLTLSDFVTPGHLFPLVAKSGGLLERRGHTEAATTLCRWAGLREGALICEMIRDDGNMYSHAEARAFAAQHGLGFATINELIEYQRRHYTNVEIVSSATLPTEYGTFRVTIYRELFSNKEHVFLAMGEYTKGPVRIHSECLTGDILSSRKCDCGGQLQQALQQISREGRGALVYLRQEGRDIGLGAKIKAYELQQRLGLDTVEANVHLGFGADDRDYNQAAWILRSEGFSEVRLLTNNPEKIIGLEKHGFRVTREELQIPAQAESHAYLKTKFQKMGHKLQLEDKFHD